MLTSPSFSNFTRRSSNLEACRRHKYQLAWRRATTATDPLAFSIGLSSPMCHSGGSWHRWLSVPPPGRRQRTRASPSPAHMAGPIPQLPLLSPRSAAGRRTRPQRGAALYRALVYVAVRRGAKFRELVLRDLASKANPSGRSFQNSSRLTHCEQKPFVTQTREAFSVQRLWTWGRALLGHPVEPSSGTGRRGGRAVGTRVAAAGEMHFSVCETAELAITCPVLCPAPRREWLAAARRAAPRSSWLCQLRGTGGNAPIHQQVG